MIVEVHDKKWKVKFTIEKEDIEEEGLKEIKPDTCEVQVELLKMPLEEDPLAIKFTRVSGSIILFLDYLARTRDQFEK